jgi:formate transporter
MTAQVDPGAGGAGPARAGLDDGGPGALDARPPAEIARRVERAGVAKARADSGTVLVLSLLAGAFIALGALFYLSIRAQGHGPLLGGLGFSLGLVLVVVAGAELFTGNNLVAMAWASRHVTGRELLRHWALVYAGNVVGAVGTAWLADLAGLEAAAEVGRGIAEAKAGGDAVELLARGVLCNALVCLAVWLSMGARSVTDKVLAVVFPITAFVAIGLEHSIANWFFLPFGGWPAGSAANLALVTVGNVAGGTLLVAGVYWLAYLRPVASGGPGAGA